VNRDKRAYGTIDPGNSGGGPIGDWLTHKTGDAEMDTLIERIERPRYTRLNYDNSRILFDRLWTGCRIICLVLVVAACQHVANPSMITASTVALAHNCGIDVSQFWGLSTKTEAGAAVALIQMPKPSIRALLWCDSWPAYTRRFEAERKYGQLVYTMRLRSQAKSMANGR